MAWLSGGHAAAAMQTALLSEFSTAVAAAANGNRTRCFARGHPFNRSDQLALSDVEFEWIKQCGPMVEWPDGGATAAVGEADGTDRGRGAGFVRRDRKSTRRRGKRRRMQAEQVNQSCYEAMAEEIDEVRCN